MTPKLKTVRVYLLELEKTKVGRSEQVREGLEIYVGLWRKALEKGAVSEADSVDDALAKIDRKGGLYKAAEE